MKPRCSKCDITGLWEGFECICPICRKVLARKDIGIEDLYKMQIKLDENIIQKQGLEGKDLYPNTVLALLVEMGETANEWRGFKHWSKDQTPRFERKCHACDGEGGFMTGEGPEDSELCMYCDGTGVESLPLIEEYVDCVHFFLSIARQKQWLDHLYFYEDALEERRESGLDGGITGALLETMYWLNKMYMENDQDERIEKTFGYGKKEFCFANAWFCFICIGIIGFGFTWEQITQAYVDKNKVNFERQDNGY